MNRTIDRIGSHYPHGRQAYLLAGLGVLIALVFLGVRWGRPGIGAFLALVALVPAIMLLLLVTLHILTALGKLSEWLLTKLFQGWR